MKIKTTLVPLFCLLLLSGCANSPSGSISSQEKCSESAKLFFNNHDAGLAQKDKYSNHYNRKLDRCLVLIVTHARGNAGLLESESLYNVYENTYLGGKSSLNGGNPIMCNVGESNCDGNRGEWEKLIKSYME